MNSSTSKVFCLGWDGATWNVADPMLRAGQLPNMARLIERGTRMKLRSTVPPNSSIAWTTFATGKNAGKHGVYYFVERTPDSYSRRIINATSIRTETLWSILSRHDKRVSVVNVPVTFPPEPVNGTMVCGMLSPSPESAFTHPPTLHTELIAQVGPVPMDHVEGGVAYATHRMALLEDILRDQERRCRMAAYLMDRDPWDFFMLVLTSSDRIGHVAMRFKDEQFRAENPALTAKFGDILEQTYAQLDRLTGDLLRKLDDDTHVLLFSDHGMGPLRKHFHLGRWLREKGYLVLKAGAQKKRTEWELRKRRVTDRIRVTAPGRRPRPIWDLVDWEKTRAYPSWGGGEDVVLVNLAGREPEGSVAPGEDYEQLCEEICRELGEIVDPDTGRPVIPAAHKRRDLWHGDHVDLAPDIQFEVDDVAYHIECDIFSEGPILVRPEDPVPGMHRMDGILVAAGPGIRSGEEGELHHLIDMTPTICHLLGVPVPEDMDGQVIEALYTGEFGAAHPVIAGPPTQGGYHVEKEDFDGDEADAVAETLRSMGYVS